MSYREIIHEGLGITSSDISDEYDHEKLLHWKRRVDEDIQMMSIDIEHAKSRAKLSDEYSDPEWFHKINMKKKYYGLLSQKIQNQLSLAKKRKRKKFENVFVDVCARELDKGLFDELRAQAHAEIEFASQEEQSERL